MDHATYTVYLIRLCGCDAATDMELALTPRERDLLLRVARVSEEVSDYECMPVLRVQQRNDDGEWEELT